MSNETKKYELVKSESIVHNGRTLYRIRALREFTFCKSLFKLQVSEKILR